MGFIRRYLLVLVLGIGFLIVAGIALTYPNDWWLSGLMTASIVAWLTGVLAVAVGRPKHRAAVIGAVLAGFLYVLFAVGPWFRVHVGPWLVTSQALVHIETKWLGRQPQTVQQQLAFTNVQQPYPLSWAYGTGSGVVTIPQVTAGQALALVAATGVSPPGQFVAVGHWVCGWLAAGLGAIAAAWITRPKSKSNGISGKEDQP